MAIFTQAWFIVLICVVFGVPLLLGVVNFILRRMGKKRLQDEVHDHVRNNHWEQRRTQRVKEKNAQHVRDVVKKYDKKHGN